MQFFDFIVKQLLTQFVLQLIGCDTVLLGDFFFPIHFTLIFIDLVLIQLCSFITDSEPV